MIWQLNTPTLLLFLAGLLNLALVINIWPKRHTALGASFIALSTAVSIWSFSDFIQLGLPDSPWRIFWLAVAFIGIGFTPVCFFIFSLYYAGRGHWVTKRLLSILILANIWQPVAIWTSPQNGLFYQSLAKQQPIRGALFFVHAGIGYLIIGASFVVLIALIRRDQNYRQRALLLLGAASIPVVYNVFLILRITPTLLAGIDLTPISFTLSILLLISNVFRENALDFLPRAYRDIFHYLDNPIIVVDKFDQIIDMNHAAEKIAAHPLNSCLQKPVGAGFPPLKAKTALFSPHSSRTEVAWPATETTYDVQITPLLDARDIPRGRIILLSDVSQQKQTEQILRDQYQIVQELARKHKSALLDADLAHQTKDNFLANMSHELRTPLNAILGYTGLVVDEVVDNQYPNLLPDLHKIQNSGYHLLDIITDILNLTKIETQKFELYNDYFPLTALLEELHQEVAPLLVQNNNTFTKICADGLPDIYADEQQVFQVLSHLVNNAAKFTHQGHITIDIHQEQSAGREWIACVITDTGIGIPQEKIELILKPFAQGDDSHTKTYEGIGIGLTISYQLCRLMGGHLKLDSSEHVGTTATVYFPTAPVNQTAVKPNEGQK